MRRLPILWACLLLLGLLAPLAPVGSAAGPTPLSFNGQPSSDVRGTVTSVSADGPGRFGAASVADAGVTLPDEADLAVFNLPGGAGPPTSGGKAWDAADDDLLNEGGRLVRIANGTGGQGDWIVLVNQTAVGSSSVITGYRTGGGCNVCRQTWQYNRSTAPINGLDLTADGRLIALATGSAAGANNSYILLRNEFDARTPRELFRVNGLSNPNPDLASVSKFTSVALSVNQTMPLAADSGRATVAVLGAETTSATQGVKGAVFVFQTVWDSTDNPTSSLIQTVITPTPVTDVDITFDGEYAVAGTQGGTVYLLSVAESLQRRGVGVSPPLRAWEQTLPSGVTRVAIARFSGEIFAAGTSDGELVVFRNDRSPGGSEGAQGVEVRRSNVNTPFCGPQRLSGAVTSLALDDYGQVLVAGGRDGLLQFEPGAFAAFGGASFEPSWCIPLSGGESVPVDVSGDGRRVFAGAGRRVYGYSNFFKIAVEPESATKDARPGERAQFRVTVRNDGSLFDRVNLTLAGPQDPGWSLDLSNTSLLLYPGKSQVVTVNATTPIDLKPGNFTLNLGTRPERNPSEVTETQLRLNVGQLRSVEIRPVSGELIASAGTLNSFPVTIHNGGNAQDRFRVTATIPEPQSQYKSPGSDWIVRVDPALVDILPGSDATVNLQVTPQPARRGDFVWVDIHVEPEVPGADDELLTDTRQVKVIVEPSFNGEVVLAEPNRDYRAEPGQLIFINWTVKNLGNSRDVFTVKNRTEPANAAGWRLQLSDEKLELRTQGSQKVVRMAVSAQLGLQPGDNVRIVVDLLSEGLSKQTPGSDGKVDEQSVTVTVVPRQRAKFLGIPAPEPLLIAAAALATALAARRRGA